MEFCELQTAIPMKEILCTIVGMEGASTNTKMGMSTKETLVLTNDMEKARSSFRTEACIAGTLHTAISMAMAGLKCLKATMKAAGLMDFTKVLALLSTKMVAITLVDSKQEWLTVWERRRKPMEQAEEASGKMESSLDK